MQGMAYNEHTLEKGAVLYYGSAKFKSMSTTRSMFKESRINFPSSKNFFLSTKDVAMLYTSPYEDAGEHFGSAPPAVRDESNLNRFVTIKKSRFVIFNDPANIEMLLYKDPDSPFHFNNRKKYTFPAVRGIGELTSNHKKFAIHRYLRSKHAELNYPELENSLVIPDDINNSMFAVLILATGIYTGNIARDSSYKYDFWIADLFKEYFNPKGIDGWWQPEEARFHEEYCIFAPEEVIAPDSDDAPTDVVYHPGRDLHDHDCHNPAVCANPLKFDDENQKALDRIYEEMIQYPNASDIYDAGTTIADHSVWVLRTIYNWLGFRNEPWTADIWPEFREATMLAAFLHDIGKIGDRDTRKPAEKGDNLKYTSIGYQYLTEEKPFLSLKSTCDNFITCFGLKIPETVFPVIASVVALHRHFVELIVRYSIYRIRPDEIGNIRTNIDVTPYKACGLSFLVTALSYIVELKYIIVLHSMYKILKLHDTKRLFMDNRDNIEQLLLILCAVGAADVFGSYPVDVSRDVLLYSHTITDVYDPRVMFRETDSSRDNFEMNRPYYKFGYGTLGLAERAKLIEYSRLAVNYDTLCEAWDGFRPYLECVESNRMDAVPEVYRTLPTGTPEEYLTSLFCLLKVGAVKLQPPRVQQYQPRDEQLMGIFAKEGSARREWRDGISEYLMTYNEELSAEQMGLLRKLHQHHITM
jgi:hypothetical protein